MNDLTRDLPQLPAKVVGLADPDALYAKATEAMERAETALTGKQGG